MEQKNSKIALFMIVFSFCLDFIQGNPISNLGMNCFKQAKLEQCINIDINSGLNICSQIDTNLECVEHLLSECYTTQELNTVKKVFLKYMYSINGPPNPPPAVFLKISQFKFCQKYKDTMAAKANSKGSIAGVNMDTLIAFFIAVAYFGI